MKAAALILLGAMVAGAIAIAIFDPDSLSGPDAEQQEEALTACLREAGFDARTEIPSLGPPSSRNAEYRVEVRRRGDALAYIHLFDFPEQAETFVEDAKLAAESDDDVPAYDRRGRAAVDLDPGAPTTPAIRGCVEEAGRPPEA